MLIFEETTDTNLSTALKLRKVLKFFKMIVYL